jgi:NAD(P)-dependent dehydrogenase (short-subunit alcohol dehydrogenase family)
MDESIGSELSSEVDSVAETYSVPGPRGSCMTAATGGRLVDCVAIVTGAGSGNGRAISRAFAAEGASVVCADLNGEAAAQTVALIEPGAALAVTMDHCEPDDCERTVRAALTGFGRVNVLVNNAGILGGSMVADVTIEMWRRVFAVNVEGPLLMTKAAIPHMRAARGGSIVMIGSDASIAAHPGAAPYVASKHALLGLTRSIAIEHAAEKIRANIILPWEIDTPLLEAAYSGRVARGFVTTVAEARQLAADSYPLGRLGEPDDVAAAAVYLGSADSKWTTGTMLLVNGGKP